MLSRPQLELVAAMESSKIARDSILPKKAWREAVDTAVDEAHQADEQIAVIFMDVDHFKNINDCFGHEFGDEVIERIRESVQKNLRLTEDRPKARRDVMSLNSDVFKAGHVGGDEFAVLCKTDEKGALALVERLRSGFNEDITKDARLRDLGINLSLGVAVLQPGMSSSELLAAADQDMYEDKLGHLPELNEQQIEFIEQIKVGLAQHDLRLRDIGKHLLRLSRESELAE